MNALREVDGLKIGFVEHDTYFASMLSPSMTSTARETGADVVFLLAPGVTPDSVTDDEIRVLLDAARNAKEEQGHDS